LNCESNKYLKHDLNYLFIIQDSIKIQLKQFNGCNPNNLVLKKKYYDTHCVIYIVKHVVGNPQGRGLKKTSYYPKLN